MSSVGIVGGGAAGVLVAANLLRRLGTGSTIHLVESSPALGRGVPYGTTDARHLLNVRAGNMSAYPEDPRHFARWYASRTGQTEDVAATQFAPRILFGEYVYDVLQSANLESPADLVIVPTRARSLSDADHLELRLENGEALALDHIVLATGHLPPSVPRELQSVAHHPRFVRDPWHLDASLLSPDNTIFLVGTGLTMVDMVVSLAGAAHQGKIWARSRRGLLPQAHWASPPRPVDLGEIDLNHLRRSISKLIRDTGEDWRAVMDGLRPHSEFLWQQLSWHDRKRFIDRMRPYWDSHRHRVPESIAWQLAGMQEKGTLNVGKGSIRSISASTCAVGAEHPKQNLDEPPTSNRESLRSSIDGFLVDLGSEQIHADWIINCTGPELNLQGAKIGVLESAVESGLVEYDPLGLGLMVDSEGRCVPSRNVWALGPLCRGCRWETTAIPEIRAQAARIAEAIAASPSSALRGGAKG